MQRFGWPLELQSTERDDSCVSSDNPDHIESPSRLQLSVVVLHMVLGPLFLVPIEFGWQIFRFLAPTVLAVVLLGYFVPHAIVCVFFGRRDLKKAYDAEWALVTGASSGIGKAISCKLAEQGLNVVMVALQDSVLDQAYEELRQKYPSVQLRKVGANLAEKGYLETIAKATNDICVQLIFNNAGYMLSGFFESRPLESHLANIECNATSAVTLTHHFLTKLIQAKKRGGFVFTSSAAAAICSPFTTLYSGTKSFLSAFAAGLAVEVRHHGIDVLVIHPSPVNTRFYDKSQSLSVLDFFKARAVSPDTLPDAIFGSLGRTIWRDIGVDAVGFRLLTKMVDYNLLAWITSRIATTMPDFKKAQQASQSSRKKA